MSREDEQRMEDIRARLEAVTPGEWEWRDGESGTEYLIAVTERTPTGRIEKWAMVLYGWGHDWWGIGFQRENKLKSEPDDRGPDAEFIVHAPDDMRWLLEALDSPPNRAGKT